MEQFEGQEQITESNSLKKIIEATAKAAGIAAIISLLATVVWFVSFILAPPQITAEQNKEGFDEGAVQAINQVSYFSAFLMLAIGVLAFYFLYRFSTLAKASLKNNDQPKLTTALYSLARYFKIWGVILFVVISLFVLSLIAGIFAGGLGG